MAGWKNHLIFSGRYIFSNGCFSITMLVFGVYLLISQDGTNGTYPNSCTKHWLNKQVHVPLPLGHVRLLQGIMKSLLPCLHLWSLGKCKLTHRIETLMVNLQFFDASEHDFLHFIYIYTYIRYMINLNDNIRYIHIFIHNIFITPLRIHCVCTHTFHPLHTSAGVPSSFPVKRSSRIPTKSFSRRIFATRRTQNRWCWLVFPETNSKSSWKWAIYPKAN